MAAKKVDFHRQKANTFFPEVRIFKENKRVTFDEKPKEDLNLPSIPQITINSDYSLVSDKDAIIDDWKLKYVL